MKRHMALMLMVALALTLLAGDVFAQGGQGGRRQRGTMATGEITAVDATSKTLTVKKEVQKEGEEVKTEEVTVKTGEETRIRIVKEGEERPASGTFDDLKVGMFVRYSEREGVAGMIMAAPTKEALPQGRGGRPNPTPAPKAEGEGGEGGVGE